MLKFLKLKPNERKIIIQHTAKKLNIQSSLIEKDFWVCLILYYLFNYSKFKKDLIFGGGTSLSKCYHCIQRFSEDIDIAINWEVLGFSHDPLKGKSKTKQKETIANLNTTTINFVKNQLLPDLKEGIKRLTGLELIFSIDKDNPLTILCEYPKLFNSKYVLKQIRIEVGHESQTLERVKMCVKPYISTISETFNVAVLPIEKIFYDKALILHRLSHLEDKSKFQHRYARHYYDLYCIGSDKKLLEKILKRKDIYKAVVINDISYHYRAYAHFEECLENNIKLIPNKELLAVIKNDYNEMIEMFFIKPPAFEKIVNFLSDIERKIKDF
ncbi:MAG: nucleotidyl transferase AbiEii/AbiGii toxin family protein [Malacoplasma sp.]|nr:nucleotidyl transferase AbiEii/AbiGii toxin family protein [Malacoplasma sp.]